MQQVRAPLCSEHATRLRAGAADLTSSIRDHIKQKGAAATAGGNSWRSSLAHMGDRLHIGSVFHMHSQQQPLPVSELAGISTTSTSRTHHLTSPH